MSTVQEMQEAMVVGAARYAQALTVLGRYGPAEFTQTGGMCAALQVRLERGYLLITDVDDSLPWDPTEMRGWGVGFYPTEDACEGPDAFVDGDDPSPNALPGLVEQCLRELVSQQTARSSGSVSWSDHPVSNG